MRLLFRLLSLAPAASVLLAPGASAQQLKERPVPSHGVVSFTFDSPSMGVRFAVNVAAPRSFKPGTARKYPALITTDGDWAFPGVLDAAQSLMQQGAIEDLFLVSIGTGEEDGDTTWTQRRIYEFSPPNWDRKDPFGVEVTRFCQLFRSPAAKCTGGAPAFLTAIATELVPLIAARYPIDREQLGLFGISAGGFFASWSIFQSSSPFRKYLISSPAMAYGDGEIFRQEARWAAEHKDLPVAIYFAAGQLEIQDGSLEGVGQIVSGMTHLAGVLAGRRYPGLKLTTEIHPGLSHGDVMGTTVAHGLRVLYGK